MTRKRKISSVLCLALLIIASFAALALAGSSDISGHWAESTISSWLTKGLITGYGDGTFKPEQTITRAEFVALVNRAFDLKTLKTSESAEFYDVKKSDWFDDEIEKAKAVGYVSGYPDGTFRPGQPINRQEAAVILAKLLSLSTDGNSLSSQFKDAQVIPAWSRGAVEAAAAKGLIRGYGDQTFRPFKKLTRAEAVIILEGARKLYSPSSGQESPVTIPPAAAYTKPGTYGPEAGTNTVEGNAVISSPGVTLQNTIITGNLELAAGIGDGDVNLKNVTVKGTTVIAGGGSHSIVLQGCVLPNVVVTKNGVRIVAAGNTSVNLVRLESGAQLVESALSGPGFQNITVSGLVPSGAVVELVGSFADVNIDAAGVAVTMSGGTTANLKVSDQGKGASVKITGSASIETLILNASAAITGSGAIGTAKINVSGSSLQQIPGKIEKPVGITVTIGSSGTGGSSSGSSGSGTGSGTGGNNPLNFVSSEPSNGSNITEVRPTIKLTFDRGVVRDYWENNQNCFSLKNSSGQTIGITVARAADYESDAEKRNIYVTPTADLAPGTYTLAISKDLKANNGNTLGHDVTVTFTVASTGSGGGSGGNSGSGSGSSGSGTGSGTGGNNPLNFVSSEPSNGSNITEVRPTIKLTFDRGVVRDYWENNQNCFSLNNSSGQAIGITVARAADYESDAEKRNIYVTPTADLAPGTYTLTISKDLKANNGNTLGEDKTITFTVSSVNEDTAPPTFAEGYPQVTETGQDSIIIRLKTNEAGMVYYVCLAAGAGAPSASQVKSGLDSSNAAATMKGSASMAADKETSITVSGLSSNTAYDIYVAAEDVVGNLQTNPVKLEVTTACADQSGFTVQAPYYTTQGNKIPLTISEAKGVNGIPVQGSAAVTVTSDNNYRMFNDEVVFTDGSTTLMMDTDALSPGIHTLTVTVSGITGTRAVQVIIASSSMDSSRCTVDVSPPLGKGAASTVTVTLRDASGYPLASTKKNIKVVVTVINNNTSTAETYKVWGNDITTTKTLTQCATTNESGQFTFDIIMPGTIDPGDGISVQVTQNNGSKIDPALSYTEPTI